MDASPDASVPAIRRYLQAVYPQAQASLEALNASGVRSLFEALDYYYACHPTRAKAMLPELGCSNISAVEETQRTPPHLPYLPKGAYFRAHRAQHRGRQRWNTNGAFLDHLHPVEKTQSILVGDALATFHSALAGRAGPQPAWTNPFAITRYVWYPNGMEDASSVTRSPDVARALLEVTESDVRVKTLRQLVDGDWVEVENFGGPLWAPCPPSCGLWANIWRGTGVFMRVRRPFISLSKSTAIIEMLQAVGRSKGGEEQLLNISSSIGVLDQVVALRTQYPNTPLADMLAIVLMTSKAPCTSLTDWPIVEPLFAAEWRDWANRTTPDDVQEEIWPVGRLGRVAD
ncbi:MAG: hypothetical protein SGPRY_007997 [Prymnesium sp.]